MKLIFTSILFYIASSLSVQASLLNISGSGTLNNIGDQISGDFTFDTGTVGYTLTMDNNPQSTQVNFNTSNAGDITFNVGSPSINDTWSATFSFTSPVDIDLYHLSSYLNGSSSFDFSWNTSDSASILDPSDQLINETAGPGSASFDINPNPGSGGNTSNGGSVFGPSDFLIDSPMASQMTMTWTAINNLLVQNERLHFRFDTATEQVPLTNTLWLSAFGLLLLRRRKQIT